jgi:hypothetical protein
MNHNTIPQLFAFYGIFRRDMHKWRVVKEHILGEIRGLPQSHGKLLCTNGILCMIEVGNTNQLFEGHLEWFEPYRPEDVVVVKELLDPAIAARRRNAERDAVANRYLSMVIVDEPAETIEIKQHLESPL